MNVEEADKLALAGLLGTARESATNEFWKVRNLLASSRPVCLEATPRPDDATVAALRGLAIPEAWPAELRLYNQGARLWLLDETASAVDCWRRLLDLPESDRRFFGVRAAYMLGRLLARSDLEQAIEAMRTCRRIARESGCDPLLLAIASLGWEAHMELRRGNYSRAAALYVQELNIGAHRTLRTEAETFLSQDLAMVSLARLVSAFLAEATSEQRSAAAADSFFRKVVTAHLLPRSFSACRESRSETILAWCTTLRSVAAELDPSEQTRVAWALYAEGDYEGAADWMRNNADPNPVAERLRGKLALQAGRIVEANQLFQRSALAMGANEAPLMSEPAQDISSWAVTNPPLFSKQQAAADAGICSIATGAFVTALDWMIRSGFWADAAFVAERLISVEELLAHIRSHYGRPHHEPTTSIMENGDEQSLVVERLHYLLARRLAREGLLTEAARWYPEKIRPDFQNYATALAEARKTNNPMLLYQVALTHRAFGMEFFGTEVAPDEFRWDGALDGGLSATILRGAADGNRLARNWETESDLLSIPTCPKISADERFRLRRYGAHPDKRFHYRYVASDIAWRAALQMPNGSPDLIRTLNPAGSWIKNLDPTAADRFYKALVWRNFGTPAGREADARRWFLSDERLETLLGGGGGNPL